MKEKILVIGAGGFAREAISWALQCERKLVGVYSEKQEADRILGLPMFKDLAGMDDCTFLVAIGDPKTRERLFKHARNYGLEPCRPIVHPSCIMGIDVQIGSGSIVCPKTVITTNVKIGCGALINLGCTIGHDVVVNEFVTMSPGVNISGHCSIGEKSYLGTNSSIREGLKVGKQATLGMGACLTKSMPDGETWVGVPAKKV